MSLKKIAGWMFWVVVILIAAPALVNVALRSGNEINKNPIGSEATGFLGSWVNTALGNTGSGSGFGGFGSSGSPDDLVKAVRDAEAAVKANRSRISEEKRAAQRRAEDLAIKEKEIGIVVEWHPRVTWKDVNTSTSGPAAVTVKVYRNDLPGGLTLVAKPLCKRGDPPTNLEEILVDGGEYLFQARVGATRASAPFGPLIYIKGKGFQNSIGTTVVREPLELHVFL